MAFLVLIIEIVAGGNPLDILDTPMHDALERAALKKNNDIVLVDLDEESVGYLGDKVTWLGLWLPSIIEHTRSAKAVGVTLPCFFEHSVPLEGQEKLKSERADTLAKGLRLPPAKVTETVDSLFNYVNWDKDVENAISSNSNVYLGFRMLDEVLGNEILPFSEQIAKRNRDSLISKTRILNKADYLSFSYKWVISSRGIGFLDVLYDKRGVVREIPLIALCKGEFYTPLPLSMLQGLEGRKDIDLPRSRILKLGNEEYTLSEGYGFRIHFTSNLADFKSISVKSILSNEVNPDTFKDKIVFIGSSFDPYSMPVNTPVDARMPRMVLEANLLSNLINREQAVPPGIVATFIVTIVLAGLGAFAVMLQWRKFTLPAFGLLLIVFYLVVASTARNGTRIDFFVPLFSSLIAIGAGYVVYYQIEGRQRNYIKQMVAQFFPKENEKELVERFMNLPYLKINKESVVMAVYLDFIKKEKSLQEALKSFEEFRKQVLAICRSKGGLRMSFEGNSSIFLFSGKEGYTKACQASLEIRRFFTNFNAKYVTEAVGEFNLGIGLASGETLLSTLGSVPLVDLAVFGQPVLLARELALLNFELKTKVLLEGGLKDYVPADSKLRELGELEIIGEKHLVYEYLR